MFKGFVRVGELRRYAAWASGCLLLLLLVSLSISMEGVCWDKTAAEAVKIDEAAGCAEFWFNRYQTFIGAIAAIAAGWAAWRGAMTQVARADAQIKILNQQAAIDRIEYLNNKLILIDELHNSIYYAAVCGNAAIESVNNAKELVKTIHIEALQEGWSHLKTYDNAYNSILARIDSEAQALQNYISKINILRDSASMPEDVRKFPPKVCYDFTTYYNEIIRQIPNLRSPVSTHSSFDAAAPEYADISHSIGHLPSKVDVENFEVYPLIAEQRDKLFVLRRPATQIAET